MRDRRGRRRPQTDGYPASRAPVRAAAAVTIVVVAGRRAPVVSAAAPIHENASRQEERQGRDDRRQADQLEILLFLVGVVCLALELFVFPGFAVFGLSGILLILASVIMASHTFVGPTKDSNRRTHWSSGAAPAPFHCTSSTTKPPSTWIGGTPT